MRDLNNGVILAAVLTVAFAACGGSTAKDNNLAPTLTGTGVAGDQSSGAEAGAAGASEAAGAGGASAADDSCEEKHDAPPGPAIVELSQKGSGACASTTLADAVAQVRALRPDLSDVTQLYNPNPEAGGDGSFIYAFAAADGGFALVFKRGGGDCPSGCTVNDYWYFETDSACQIAQVGEAHDSGACTAADQLPRWGVPAATAPRDICGADNSPAQLSGTYDLVTCGSDSGCTPAGEQAALRTLPSTITLKIEQNSDDLNQGTVTLDGTGNALLDAQPFAATFDRQSFVVNVNDSGMPDACVETRQIQLAYDFEGYGARHLQLFQAGTAPDCTQAAEASCKGELNADFGDAQLRK